MYTLNFSEKDIEVIDTICEILESADPNLFMRYLTNQKTRLIHSTLLKTYKLDCTPKNFNTPNRIRCVLKPIVWAK
jgi:hypothetical protein